MNVITKVSSITAQDIAEYLRLVDITQDDLNYITTLIGVAKDYILKYTGIADLETLDNYNDMVIAVFVLVQDMYDNRTLYVDSNNVNRTVDVILGLHQRNLL